MKMLPTNEAPVSLSYCSWSPLSLRAASADNELRASVVLPLDWAPRSIIWNENMQLIHKFSRVIKVEVIFLSLFFIKLSKTPTGNWSEKKRYAAGEKRERNQLKSD